MLSFLYLITAAILGWQITDQLIPSGRTEKMNLIWVRAAASFGVGTLVLTWPLYLTAYILHTVFANETPLTLANTLILGIAIVLIVMVFVSGRENAGESGHDGGADGVVTAGRNSEKPGRMRGSASGAFAGLRKSGLISDPALFRREAVFYVLVLAFVWFTFHHVLYMDGTEIRMGNTVFSDYAPNVSLIRSFAWFPNYPTQYPFFAGEDIKYHFMFMFFTGNMEFLGLPVVFAYNLTSTLSLFGFFIMLTQFALRVTGRFSAAVLTAFFFTFRSGLALFLFIREHFEAGDLVEAFRENSSFIGYTTSEEWGLWNYNVYLNQRHLGFGLIIAATLIWYFYGYIEEACGKASAGDGAVAGCDGAVTGCDEAVSGCDGSASAESYEDANGSAAESAFATDKTEEQMGRAGEPAFESAAESAFATDTTGTRIGSAGEPAFVKWLHDFVLSKEAWMPKAPDLALTCGIILGLASFWNGACVIGGLLILAGFAVFSQHKLDYLIMAICSVLLANLQTKAFIYGSAVAPKIYLGFISGTKSLSGMVWYLTEITGLTVVGSVAAAFVVKREEKILIAALWLPVIFTFTISLTPDVTVNHKYIMIVMAYMSVIWAGLVPELFSEKAGRSVGWHNIGGKAVAVLLVVLMTATGLYDYAIIIRNNGDGNSISVDTKSDLTAYVRENLTYDDMVLSAPHSVSELTVTGCRLYCGWPYYAWSAGYDTDTRFMIAKEMYTAMTAEEIRELLHAEGITYVLYEDDMLYDDAPAREEPFEELCELVFTSADGYYRLYKVR